MNQVRILHQLDTYQGKQCGEFWMLDGIGYREGKDLESAGFWWVGGPDGGCWSAPSRESLSNLIESGCQVIEVGASH